MINLDRGEEDSDDYEERTAKAINGMVAEATMLTNAYQAGYVPADVDVPDPPEVLLYQVSNSREPWPPPAAFFPAYDPAQVRRRQHKSVFPTTNGSPLDFMGAVSDNLTERQRRYIDTAPSLP